MVPVSLNSLSLLHTAFMNCFGSQSAASFPSYEHDGPFSELAQKIQVEQYAMVKCCLGNDFFLKHTHPRLRRASLMTQHLVAAAVEATTASRPRRHPRPRGRVPRRAAAAGDLDAADRALAGLGADEARAVSKAAFGG